MTQEILDTIVTTRRAAFDRCVQETEASQDQILCAAALAWICTEPENRNLTPGEVLHRITQEGNQ